MLCWLITICTIARLWIVISVICLRNENEGVWPRLSCENCIVHSWFVWMLWTREEVSLTDSAGIRDSRTRNEGRREEVSLNDSAGIRDSRMRTRGGGRKWVWTTQLAFAIREWERGAEGGSESERLTEWFTATRNTTERLNERTNERTTLFGELNDTNWFAEKNHESTTITYIKRHQSDGLPWIPCQQIRAMLWQETADSSRWL